MGTRKKVLLVETDPDLRKEFCEILESEGYSSICTETYSDGLARLQCSDPPALIIFDCAPPCRSGQEFLQGMKALDGKLAHIPVLLIFADVSIQKKYAHAEIAGFLSKPLDLEVFISAVEKFAMVEKFAA